MGKRWGGRAEQFELEGGRDCRIPKLKNRPAGTASRIADPNGPASSNFLRLNAQAGTPVLVKVDCE